MTHTPGPWIVDGKPGYEAPEIHAGNRRIARVLYHLGSADREVDANARLIAASPVLLELLMKVRRYDRDRDLLYPSLNKVVTTSPLL